MNVGMYVLIGGLIGFALSIMYGLSNENSIFRKDSNLKTQFHPEYILQLLAVPINLSSYWDLRYPQLWFMNWIIVASIGCLIGYLVYVVATYA